MNCGYAMKELYEDRRDMDSCCRDPGCIAEKKALKARILVLESQSLKSNDNCQTPAVTTNLLEVSSDGDVASSDNFCHGNVTENTKSSRNSFFFEARTSFLRSLPEVATVVISPGDEEFLEELVNSIFQEGYVVSVEEQCRFGEIIQLGRARIIFVRLLNNLRAKSLLITDETFYRLVQFVSVALNECAIYEDYSPAKTLMNLCFTFYRVCPNEQKEFLHTELNALPIWRSDRFWEAAFFYAVSSENSRSKTSGRPFRSLSENERENSRISESNVIFGQLICFVTNMATMGMDVDSIDKFADKMALIGGLNEELLGLLSECLDANVPRTTIHIIEKDIFGEGISARKDKSGRLRVGSIRFGSPASFCEGLKSTDIILSLNGQSCNNTTAAEFSRKLKEGPSTLTLVVYKARESTVDALQRRSSSRSISVNN